MAPYSGKVVGQEPKLEPGILGPPPSLIIQFRGGGVPDQPQPDTT